MKLTHRYQFVRVKPGEMQTCDVDIAIPKDYPEGHEACLEAFSFQVRRLTPAQEDVLDIAQDAMECKLEDTAAKIIGEIYDMGLRGGESGDVTLRDVGTGANNHFVTVDGWNTWQKDPAVPDQLVRPRGVPRVVVVREHAVRFSFVNIARSVEIRVSVIFDQLTHPVAEQLTMHLGGLIGRDVQ
jgi:hypothetical protein